MLAIINNFLYVFHLDDNNSTNTTTPVPPSLATQLNNLPLSSEILTSLIAGEPSALTATDKLNGSESIETSNDVATATVSNSQM